MAESAQASPENRRREKQGRSEEEGASPKLKGITRGKTQSCSAVFNRSLIKKKSLPSALVSNSPSMKKLYGTSKGITNTRVGLKRPRLDLQFLCTNCNSVSFNTGKGLYQHKYRYCKNKIPADLIVKKLLCPDCQEKSFSSPMGLTMHRRKFCRNKRPGIFCFNCNKIFSSSGSLSTHMKKCAKTPENGEQKEGFKTGMLKEKEYKDKAMDQEHNSTKAVQDKESRGAKVIITVKCT